jgi:hypothetical protein
VAAQAESIGDVLTMEIVRSRVVRRIQVIQDQDFHAISATERRLATKMHENARKNLVRLFSRF